MQMQPINKLKENTTPTPFILKLYELVNNPDSQHLVCFLFFFELFLFIFIFNKKEKKELKNRESFFRFFRSFEIHAE